MDYWMKCLDTNGGLLVRPWLSQSSKHWIDACRMRTSFGFFLILHDRKGCEVSCRSGPYLCLLYEFHNCLQCQFNNLRLSDCESFFSCHNEYISKLKITLHVHTQNVLITISQKLHCYKKRTWTRAPETVSDSSKNKLFSNSKKRTFSENLD